MGSGLTKQVKSNANSGKKRKIFLIPLTFNSSNKLENKQAPGIKGNQKKRSWG